MNISSINSVCDREQDSLALVSLYDVLDGDNWNNNTNWKTVLPINTWHGVFDTDQDGCIDSISLANNNLSGELNSNSINFSALKHLRLFSNNIIGSLPDQIDNLNQLTTLMFEANNISDPKFGKLANITSLREINFGGNNFSENINLSDLCGIDSLLSLALFNSGISSIPNNIDCLDDLLYFDVSSNNLSGEVPTAISRLKSLEGLHMAFNPITGSLPDSIWFLPNLERMDFRFTNVSGQIPHSIENLLNIEYIWFTNANLTGTVPITITNLPNLIGLYLTGNNIDSIPELSQFEGSPLWLFQMEDNQITFDDIIPNISYVYQFSYENQASVYKDTIITIREGEILEVDLGIDEDISTNVYKWFRNQDLINITSTNKLIIDNIQISESGTYTCEVSNPEVPNLTLYSNSIEVIIQDCRFIDSLALVSIYQNMGGINWTFNTTQYLDITSEIYSLMDVPNANSEWNFNVPIDSWYGVELNDQGCVKSLILPEVGLTGYIPEDIGNLQSLEKLYLLNNQIDGSIPLELYSLTNLKELNLRENFISGIISSEIKNLINLIGVDLTFNNLREVIPMDVGELINLKTLLIAENDLSGNVPHEINKLNEVIRLNLCCNELSGPIPDSIGRLNKLKFLSLHNNNLSGRLPDSFIEMESLVQCELYFNQLEGTIPESIDMLDNLEILQLDSNYFIGTIPESLGNLNLKVLTLRLNDFEGHFPDFSHTPLEILTLDHNRFESFPDYSSVTTWHPSLEYWSGCQIQNNKLTFDDILPNMSIGETTLWEYGPQDSIFVDTLIETSEGEDITIDLDIDESIENNKYKWYKDGNTRGALDSNKLILNNVTLDDSGDYWCHVTNDSVPDLTLKSRIISIQITAKNIGNESGYNPLLTPNDDGFNDVLEFEILASYPENSITIFNRYGETVFEVTPYLNDWKGTFQESENMLPDGTYYYVLNFGDEELLKGYITILSK